MAHNFDMEGERIKCLQNFLFLYGYMTLTFLFCFCLQFFPLLLKLIAWNGERYRLLFAYYNGLICKS